MPMHPLFALSLVIFMVNPVVRFATAQDSAKGNPTSIAIVELFTSEGCSSCPPADALLREINLKQANTGQLIVGISEHVTYWNDLGWKDPFSLPGFTDRQNVYASRLSPEGPYTPQMVLNGRDQFVGSDAGALERALRDDALRSHLHLSILASARSSSGLDVKLSVAGEMSGPLDIIAVLTDDADQSNVLRGENNGRLVQHVSVARLLTRVTTIRSDGEQSVHVTVPNGFLLGTGHHLILFAQEQHQGAILGATTVPL
jgi:hypothetical protein